MPSTISSSSNGSNTTNNVANILNGFDNYNDDDDDTNNAHQQQHPNNQKSLLLFTPKFQYSVKNNPLCGICFNQWLNILIERYNQIEFGNYWPRLIVITLLSIFNSILAYIESLYYSSDEISKIEINMRPVFILGHPRTGTTLLHSFLALDVEKFDICTTFCSGFPSCFLWFESLGKILFSNVIDSTRPMDNMPLDFDLPQEDELATNLLSKGKSPYMPLFFMKQHTEFQPYYTFQQQTEDLLDEDDENTITEEQLSKDRNQWINSFLFLLKKLTLRGSILLRRKQQNEKNKGSNTSPPEEPKRLLLKSPVHTARIKLLLQLFPDAQFIYIHRHPYDILRSAIHMADTTYWYTYLNTPTNEQILEFILKQYEILWESYEHDRQQLLLNQQQQQQLIEVSFEDLTRNDPLVAIQNIYKNLGWGELSSNYKSKLEFQLSSKQHTTYQRNNHKQLPDYLKSIVNKRWKESFDRLGYTMEEVKKIDDES